MSFVPYLLTECYVCILLHASTTGTCIGPLTLPHTLLEPQMYLYESSMTPGQALGPCASRGTASAGSWPFQCDVLIEQRADQSASGAKGDQIQRCSRRERAPAFRFVLIGNARVAHEG